LARRGLHSLFQSQNGVDSWLFVSQLNISYTHKYT
jgi:hypothetical protein